MSKLRKVKDLVENGNFDGAIDELLAVPSSSITYQIPIHSTQAEKQIDKYASINDRGNGRVGDGLRYLELITLMFTGKSIEGVLRFDKITRYANSSEFLKENSVSRKVEIVATSLGVEDAINTVKRIDPTYYTILEERFTQLYDEVKTGKFRYDNSKDVLALVRRMYKRLENK